MEVVLLPTAMTQLSSIKEFRHSCIICQVTTSQGEPPKQILWAYKIIKLCSQCHQELLPVERDYLIQFVDQYSWTALILWKLKKVSWLWYLTYHRTGANETDDQIRVTRTTWTLLKLCWQGNPYFFIKCVHSQLKKLLKICISLKICHRIH